MLIREDFPTFERPMKAISGYLLPGLPLSVVLLPANAAFLIFILLPFRLLSFAHKNTKKEQDSEQKQMQ